MVCVCVKRRQPPHSSFGPMRKKRPSVCLKPYVHNPIRVRSGRRPAAGLPYLSVRPHHKRPILYVPGHPGFCHATCGLLSDPRSGSLVGPPSLPGRAARSDSHAGLTRPGVTALPRPLGRAESARSLKPAAPGGDGGRSSPHGRAGRPLRQFGAQAARPVRSRTHA